MPCQVTNLWLAPMMSMVSRDGMNPDIESGLWWQLAMCNHMDHTRCTYWYSQYVSYLARCHAKDS